MQKHDIVLFGATGFTGQLVAQALATRAKARGLHWAIAGRNPDKLGRVRDELGAEHAHVPIISARSDDFASLRAMADLARVVVSTVGPFELYGDPLVEACVAAGSDYLDITGEPGFWTRTIERHHQAATERGVLMISCCGYDSIPADLGMLFTAQQLGNTDPITMAGYLRVSGGLSGGSWASLIHILADHPLAETWRHATIEADGSQAKIHHEPAVAQWVVPLPTVDPLVVRRSAQFGATGGAPLTYHHYLQARSLAKAAQIAAGGIAMGALAKPRWTRRLLLAAQSPGEGPSEAARARSKFTMTFVAQAGAQTVRTEVRGRDPGYGLTAVMLAESAVTLIEDRASLPHRGGILTPASGLGTALLTRLQRHGLEFAVTGG